MYGLLCFFPTFQQYFLQIPSNSKGKAKFLTDRRVFAFNSFENLTKKKNRSVYPATRKSNNTNNNNNNNNNDSDNV